MASGTPVITSDASCMPEVTGKAAVLVNPMDVEAMALAIEAHITDESWLQDARSRGLARATEFSWERCAEKTIAVYRQIA